MKTLLLLLLLMSSPAWAGDVELITLETADKPIVVAVNSFSDGPHRGFVKYSKGVGGAPLTNYVLTESSDNLTDESGNKLIHE
jgi:hypothetical protein